MQLKLEDRTYPNVIEPILNPIETKLQPEKRKKNWVKSQIYTDNEATGIIQPSPLLEKDEDLLICPALSSTQNNKHMVEISNFLDHPYTLTHIERKAHSKFLDFDSRTNKKYWTSQSDVSEEPSKQQS